MKVYLLFVYFRMHLTTKILTFFHPETGINIKILDYVDLPGETSQMIHDNMMRILIKHNLQEKIVAFCADNANTNFGGVNRRGHENVYFKLQQSLNRHMLLESAALLINCIMQYNLMLIYFQ